MSGVEQCRRLNVQVGDTIQGTESYPGAWGTTRLTLLWIGKEIAVWRETHQSSLDAKWTEPKESACWDLSHREWRHVGADVPATPIGGA